MLEKIDINGNSNTVFNAGRDITIVGDKSKESEGFFEPTLNYSKLGIEPVVDDFIKTLQVNSLLILGGNYKNKKDLARYIACVFHPLNEAPDVKIKIKQWDGYSDAQTLFVNLDTTDDTTLFIIPDLEPYNIDYDLEAVKIASKQRHYVIITTDIPCKGWYINDNIDDCWCEPSLEDLFKSDSIRKYLEEKLQSVPEVDYVISDMEKVVRNKFVDDLAIKLKTPACIDIFLKLVKYEISCNESLNEEKISELVELSQFDDNSIKHWFYRVLKPREQTLALGLSFFDGLFEDQCFAAIEQLVELVWGRRDASLGFLDYIDLQNLRNFFDFVPTDEGIDRIESKFSALRRNLIGVAKHTHRRHILLVLPVLVGMAQNSVAGRSFHGELYSTRPRRVLLRHSIGDTIGDIGLLSINAIENSLLQLFADDEIGVQAVGAQAISRFREFGEHDKLFDLLKSWLTDLSVLNYMQKIIDSREDKEGCKRANTRDYVFAGIAMTIGYVACYDEPGKLNSRLLDMLKEILEEGNDFVLKRLGEITLPKIVSIHLEQLKGFLCDAAECPVLLPYIAKSLSIASRKNFKIVQGLLRTWLNECSENRSKIIHEEPTKREKILATTLLTYVEICKVKTPDNDFRDFSPASVIQIIEKVLIEERHPYVRSKAIEAIWQLVRYHFIEMDDELQVIIDQMTIAEQKQMAKKVFDIFLEEREELKGGDDRARIRNRYYPIWINSKKPATSIENMMRQWVVNSKNKGAVCVAYLSESLIREDFGRVEKQCIEEIKKANENVKASQLNEESLMNKKSLIKEQKVGLLVRWLAIPFASIISSPRLKVSVNAIFPIMISQPYTLVEAMLQKFNEDGRKDIARLLKWAFRYNKYEKLIWVVLIISIVSLFFGVSKACHLDLVSIAIDYIWKR